ncbi:MAG: PEP-CTERM sorting domain-containing protein [Planctomycetales bacterium]|nr:PEP-CTERM sorting domain-containing protein [Planctomycetales bacterium]
MTIAHIRSLFHATVWLACLLSAFAPAWAASLGYEGGDIIVADYVGRIAVFDREMVFKNYLETNFNLVGGLTLTSNGELVAAGRLPGSIRRYNPAGDLVDVIVGGTELGYPIDIKTGPGDLLYVATQTAAVAELTLAGSLQRTFGSLQDPQAIAVLPNGELWVGHGTDSSDYLAKNPIQVFSLTSGELLRTIPLVSIHEVGTMHYSATSDTVLLTAPTFGIVYEYAIDCTLVRQFDSGATRYAYGVTRADNGLVYVTGQLTGNVARYHANGTFLDSIDLGPYVERPIGIIQVPVPEPAGTGLLTVGLAVFFVTRRRLRL